MTSIAELRSALQGEVEAINEIEGNLGTLQRRIDDLAELHEALTEYSDSDDTLKMSIALTNMTDVCLRILGQIIVFRNSAERYMGKL